jgi:hypothetical protein
LATTTNDGSGWAFVSGTAYASTTNAYDGSATTYATLTTTTAGAHVNDITGYDFASTVPSDATLNSVSINVQQYVSSAPRWNPPTIEAYDGATLIYGPFTLTERTSAGSDSDSITGITLAQVRSANFKIRFTANKNGTTSAIQYFGWANVTVDYSPPNVTLTVNGGSQGSTSTSPVLSQAAPPAVLSMANASQPLSSDSPSLTQQFTLVVSNAIQPVTSGVIGSMTPPVELAVNNSSQAISSTYYHLTFYDDFNRSSAATWTDDFASDISDWQTTYATWDSSNGVGGTGCLKIDFTGSSQTVELLSGSRIAATAGQTVSVSIKTKVASGATTYVGIQPYNAGGTPLATTSIPETPSDFRETFLSYILPANTASFTPYVLSTGIASGYIDDVFIKIGGDALSNGWDESTSVFKLVKDSVSHMGSAERSVVWSPDTGSHNNWAHTYQPYIPANSKYGLIVRGDGAGSSTLSGYHTLASTVTFSNTLWIEVYPYKVVNGTSTILGSSYLTVSATAASSNGYRLSAEGSSIAIRKTDQYGTAIEGGANIVVLTDVSLATGQYTGIFKRAESAQSGYLPLFASGIISPSITLKQASTLSVNSATQGHSSTSPVLSTPATLTINNATQPLSSPYFNQTFYDDFARTGSPDFSDSFASDIANWTGTNISWDATNGKNSTGCLRFASTGSQSFEMVSGARITAVEGDVITAFVPNHSPSGDIAGLAPTIVGYNSGGSQIWTRSIESTSYNWRTVAISARCLANTASVGLRVVSLGAGEDYIDDISVWKNSAAVGSNWNADSNVFMPNGSIVLPQAVGATTAWAPSTGSNDNWAKAWIPYQPETYSVYPIARGNNNVASGTGYLGYTTSGVSGETSWGIAYANIYKLVSGSRTILSSKIDQYLYSNEAGEATQTVSVSGSTIQIQGFSYLGQIVTAQQQVTDSSIPTGTYTGLYFEPISTSVAIRSAFASGIVQTDIKLSKNSTLIVQDSVLNHTSSLPGALTRCASFNVPDSTSYTPPGFVGNVNVSNQKAWSTTTGGAGLYWDGTVPERQFASAVVTGTVNYTASVRVRCSASTDYLNWTHYAFQYGNGDVSIKKVVNGGSSIIASGQTGTIGSRLYLRADGSVLTAEYGGVPKYQITDTEIASGLPGLLINSMDSIYLDDFAAGEYAPVALEQVHILGINSASQPLASGRRRLYRNTSLYRSHSLYRLDDPALTQDAPGATTLTVNNAVQAHSTTYYHLTFYDDFDRGPAPDWTDTFDSDISDWDTTYATWDSTGGIGGTGALKVVYNAVDQRTELLPGSRISASPGDTVIISMETTHFSGASVGIGITAYNSGGTAIGSNSLDSFGLIRFYHKALTSWTLPANTATFTPYIVAVSGTVTAFVDNVKIYSTNGAVLGDDWNETSTFRVADSAIVASYPNSMTSYAWAPSTGSDNNWVETFYNAGTTDGKFGSIVRGNNEVTASITGYSSIGSGGGSSSTSSSMNVKVQKLTGTTTTALSSDTYLYASSTVSEKYRMEADGSRITLTPLNINGGPGTYSSRTVTDTSYPTGQYTGFHRWITGSTGWRNWFSSGTIGPIVLKQGSSLVVNNGSQAHSSTTPALSQAHTLVINSGAQAVVSTSPALQRTHLLKAQGNIQPHASMLPGGKMVWDSFNRPDDAISGGPWAGDVAIINEKIHYKTGGSWVDRAFWNVAVNDNQFATMDISGDTGSAIEVRLRSDQNNNNSSWTTYTYGYSNNNTAVRKYVSGAYTYLGGYAVSPSFPDNIYATMEGSTLTGYYNGSETHRLTDTDIVSGYVGYRIWTQTSIFGDNFAGGDIFKLDLEQTSSGATLTVNNATQPLSSENAILAQSGSLVTANAAQNLTSTHVTITQNYLLTVAGATQTSSSTSPALVQNATLVVNNSAQTLTSTSPVTVENRTLVVANTQQALTSTSPALVQAFTLVVGNASQAVSSTSPAPVLNVTLSVQPSTQPVSSTSPVVTSELSLAVSNAFNGLSSTSPVTVQHYSLSVNNSTQALTSNALTVVHNRTLVVSNASQALASMSPAPVENKTLDASSCTQAVSSGSVTLAHQYFLGVQSGTQPVTSTSPYVSHSENVVLDGMDSDVGSYATGARTTVYDGFDRADNASLGAPWVQNANASISVNQLVVASGGVAWRLVEGYDPDNHAQVSMMVPKENAGPICRGSGDTSSITGYMVHRHAPGEWRISKVVDNVVTNLTGSYNLADHSGVVLSVSVDGDIVSGYVDGNLIGQVPDASITSGGYIGVYAGV